MGKNTSRFGGRHRSLEIARQLTTLFLRISQLPSLSTDNRSKWPSTLSEDLTQLRGPYIIQCSEGNPSSVILPFI
jgi:hypothetical protein